MHGGKTKEKTQTGELRHRTEGGDRWKRKMEGGKTNRESTQRTITVLLSLTDCCGLTVRFPVSFAG